MSRVSFLILCLPLVVGCNGCRPDDAGSEADQAEDEAPLEDFTARTPIAFPADINAVGGGIKPGHWITASQPLKSNKIDARGELRSHASASSANFRSGAQLNSPGIQPSVRPVVLPKGQLRRFDYRILPPPPKTIDSQREFLSSRFVSGGRSVFFDTGRQPFNVLAGPEFFFVILTSRPERFTKFQVSDWVRPPIEEYSTRITVPNYRIVFPPIDDLLPLSETMLDWTATAVVLWDDVTPEALTPAQQTALADWLRFGGQLIVNGADASDAVNRTTLSDVLPLRPTGNIELDPESATALLRGWQVATDSSTEKQISLVTESTGRVAVDGVLAEGAIEIKDSGNLLLERRIGRGRVVQTRFDMTSDWIANWLSYDSFVNATLLRRPRRRYADPNDDAGLSEIRQSHPELRAPGIDPTTNTRFRIAARDAVLGIESRGTETTSATASPNDVFTRIGSASGIGGWSDSSDIITFCRQILRNESGIEIPDSSLVVRALGYYLLILVPINYLIFRLVGRLEYAWFAVPLIAIGGAGLVARAARLDIGFARSQTEMAILETQPNYPRGHLSRVVAVYNSLSSTYDFEFQTHDGAAAPVRLDSDDEGETVFQTGFTEGPMLTGLAVGSNQIRMLHAEQIIDMGGGISLDDRGRLVNQTDHGLSDAVVIEKLKSGEARVAMLASCPSNSANELRWRSADSVPFSDELPMQTSRLLRQMASPASMPSETCRLIARIDGSLSGMTISPSTDQTQSQTLVLAHLKHPPLPAGHPDFNLLIDLRPVLTDDEVQGDDEDEFGADVE